MKFLVGFSLFLVSYFLFGFFINQYDTHVIPKRLKPENPSGFYDYKGVINVHSAASIGSSNIKFIVESAANAGLDFLILTDLNTYTPTVNDNYYSGVLTIDAKKYSYLDSRLILTPDKESSLGQNLGEVQVTLADKLSQPTINNKDALLYLAHPYDTGFSWNADIPEGMDGAEVINLKTMSLRAWKRSKLSTIWSLLIYPFNSKLALTRLFQEPNEEWALIDRMNQQRKFHAYAGSEASAKALPFTGYWVQFPSYQRLFEIATTHVLLKSELTGNFKSDRNKVLSALKNGQFYVAFDVIGDPKGFIATVEDKNKIYMMGSTLNLSKNTVLKVKLPARPKHFFEIIVLRDGEKIELVNEDELVLPITKPGNYRVQVRVSPLWPIPDGKRWITWIYTNSFYIKESSLK